ncbi:LPXTG cell wall anchor domain-containing protein [Pediococcus pentosaceus]|uniref:Rib/alpha-like domain-containing protein n=1 Tax=Pediococcus pentosaceus TaxID=1255 RepID=UPI001C1F0994|nr:Rib/alpha-like domain-containing protein [Pediococcus pentosaceus]MBU7002052.1 LPXTG cell wall anchor domain-containing protein [Pediococcus pentosaceus]MCG9227532.1 LPXTG cell wall anchor domain-containing protein [Pediococcus pentosaceus]MDA8037519.1 Rib/alpha-like domain-containing protein [Pediococcus pentosaceus]
MHQNQASDIQTVKFGDKLNPESGVANQDKLPTDTTYAWKDEPNTSDTNAQLQKDSTGYYYTTSGTVEVTIGDRTFEVKPEYRVELTNAQALKAKGQDVTTDLNKAPNAEDGIANKDDLPNGTKYEWVTPVDTTTPGEQNGTIKVTYPDGSTQEVDVKVTVNDTRTDAEKTPAKGQDVTTDLNKAPNAEDGIANKNDGNYNNANSSMTNDSGKLVATDMTSSDEQGVGGKKLAQQSGKAAIKQLPQTGEQQDKSLTIMGSLFLALTSLFGLGTLGKKRRKED